MPQPMIHHRLSAAWPVRLGVRRYSAAHLLGALALMVISAPFIERLPQGDLIGVLVASVVLLSSVLAVGGRRRTLVWSVVLVTPALIANWISHIRPDLIAVEVYLGTGLLFIAYVFIQLLLFVLRAPRVSSEVLCAGIASYVLLGLLWSLLYTLVDRIEPGSFAFITGPGHELGGFNAMYFSFVTLSTVGYGDITPVSGPARMLAMTEATVGMLYVAVLIARLVALHAVPGAVNPGVGDHR